MNLRARLIVAFFVLSVVPLGAMTAFTYYSNVRAVRDAAGQEAGMLAGDLGRRMRVVTAQLGDRVEQLMEEPSAQTSVAATPSAVVPSAAANTQTAVSPSPATLAPVTVNSNREVADALGDVAMLLNNIELRGLRGPGRRGGGPPGPPRAGDEGRRGGPPPGDERFGPRPDRRGGDGRGDRNNDDRRDDFTRQRSAEGPEAVAVPDASGSATAPSTDRQAAPASASDQSAAAPNGDADQDRILIDLAAIRRDVIQQYVPEGQWETLSQDERRRVVSEVDQRMRGIAQGIEVGAAEVRRRVADAQRAADIRAEAEAAAPLTTTAPPTTPTTPTTTPAPTTPTTEAANPPVATAAPGVPATPVAPRPSAPRVPASNGAAVIPAALTRTTAVSGTRLDVRVERNGEIVRRANAEINIPNLLTTVFTAPRRPRGEVPFAISKSGQLFTRTEEDRQQIAEVTADIARPDLAPGTSVFPDWIVVTSAEPSGSDLTFGIARPVGESLADLRRTTARNAGFGLACIGLALLGIVPLSGRLTRNLDKLSDGVRRIADGDYRARVAVRSQDEIGRLAGAFNQMASDVERHQRLAVGQERIKRELELGRQIQHDMLPQVPLKLGLMEISGVSVPAREVGGDFFDYFQLPSGQIALVVGDVSGKGVGAALLMANLQASLRARLALGQDLAALAGHIDIDVESNTPGPVYATLFVGILDAQTRELRYVNAGHNPQYVVRKDGGLSRMVSSGLPVGLLAGRGYTEQHLQLAAGDRLFFYTDGCVETENAADEMFGNDRLEALLSRTAVSPTEDLLAYIETQVTLFRGNREPGDDATMMVVKVG